MGWGSSDPEYEQGRLEELRSRREAVAGPLEWDGAAVTRSMGKDHGGKLLLGPLEWDGAAVTRSMSKDDWKSSDHGGKLLLVPWSGMGQQ